jgi:hypothetical protein
MLMLVVMVGGDAGRIQRSSIHTGAWSLVLSQPRGCVSTSAAFRRFIAAAFSRKWSMRKPALRSNELRQYFQKV